MKQFLLVVAALAVSTSAFAQAGAPVRQGTKCWAVTDQRGFGFLDQCADPREIAELKKYGHLGLAMPKTITGSSISNSGGGGGEGGGGGGK
jgi:hypothetical protein